MPEMMDELEERISQLRGRIRQALAAGERTEVPRLRAELRAAELSWDAALLESDDLAPVPPETLPAGMSLFPVREQVHQVLTVLGVAASPRLIVATHEALFAGGLAATKLASLRRDEERSFRAAPYSRPYYVCAALAADQLVAVRGLLAISTWSLDRRIMGPLSPRVDFLTAAIRLVHHLQTTGKLGSQSIRLLWPFTNNIPGAGGPTEGFEPSRLIAAAQAELNIHEESDRQQREAAAERARRLSDAEQLFGGEQLKAVKSATKS
ncbi:hypothetical protein [Salinispora pacifica]|uniref:hypothetical protein n=1 Tax=Salinispora pacifica TaxID=351187 RepID=UPI000484DFD6|nr:hypothetical protein [Salinispora pacifica]